MLRSFGIQSLSVCIVLRNRKKERGRKKVRKRGRKQAREKERERKERRKDKRKFTIHMWENIAKGYQRVQKRHDPKPLGEKGKERETEEQLPTKRLAKRVDEKIRKLKWLD